MMTKSIRPAALHCCALSAAVAQRPDTAATDARRCRRARHRGQPPARRGHARVRSAPKPPIRVRRAADQPTLTASGGYTRTNHVEEFGVAQPPGVSQHHLSRHSRQLLLAAVVSVAHLHGRADRCARACRRCRGARRQRGACRLRARISGSRSFACTGHWRPQPSRSESLPKPFSGPTRTCAMCAAGLTAG